MENKELETQEESKLSEGDPDFGSVIDNVNYYAEDGVIHNVKQNHAERILNEFPNHFEVV